MGRNSRLVIGTRHRVSKSCQCCRSQEKLLTTASYPLPLPSAHEILGRCQKKAWTGRSDIFCETFIDNRINLKDDCCPSEIVCKNCRISSAHYVIRHFHLLKDERSISKSAMIDPFREFLGSHVP